MNICFTAKCKKAKKLQGEINVLEKKLQTLRLEKNKEKDRKKKKAIETQMKKIDKQIRQKSVAKLQAKGTLDKPKKKKQKRQTPGGRDPILKRNDEIGIAKGIGYIMKCAGGGGCEKEDVKLRF